MSATIERNAVGALKLLAMFVTEPPEVGGVAQMALDELKLRNDRIKDLTATVELLIEAIEVAQAGDPAINMPFCVTNAVERARVTLSKGATL